MLITGIMDSLHPRRARREQRPALSLIFGLIEQACLAPYTVDAAPLSLNPMTAFARRIDHEAFRQHSSCLIFGKLITRSGRHDRVPKPLNPGEQPARPVLPLPLHQGPATPGAYKMVRGPVIIEHPHLRHYDSTYSHKTFGGGSGSEMVAVPGSTP